MKEFRVNEFLTLKLEEGNTNIYVNGEPFDQCKYLMLNIPIDETKRFEDIESIDEVAEQLGWTYDGQEGVEYDIDPETEFWGYCSNLQAWYEHNYDTRLLHSNLSFPLLKKLVEVGDTVANKVFKEEIVKRFESGYSNYNFTIVTYLCNEGYFEYLEKNELLIIFSDPNELSDVLKTFNEFFNYRALPFEDFENILLILIDAYENTGLIEQFFTTFVEAIKILPHRLNHTVFHHLRRIAKKRGWEETYYPLFLKVAPDYYAFCSVVDYYDKTAQFSLFLEFIEKRNNFFNLVVLRYLIEALNRPPYHEDYSHISLLFLTKLLNEYFPKLLELLNNLRDPSEKYFIFYKLIKTSQGTELLKENFSQIKTLFLTLLNDFDKLPEKYKKRSYSLLIEAIEGTDFKNEPTFKTWKEKNSSRFDDLKT